MDNLSRSELEALIEEWVLSERDRMITKRKLLDGIHYEALSEEVGLSPRQVQNIVRKSKRRISAHIV